MADWSEQNHGYTNVVISTIGPDSASYLVEVLGNVAFATGAYPTANQAFYIPFVVQAPYTAAQMFVLNGGAVSGNFDLGIYDLGGNRLVSKGSTAQAGTSAIQTLDITDTLLQPGAYYAAICCDNTTGAFLRGSPSNAVQCRAMGVLSQAVGAVTLPNPATFAATTATYYPFIGITSKTVV